MSGLLDGILGQVVGSAMGGNSGANNNPLGSILSGLAGSMGGNASGGGGLASGLGGAVLGSMLGGGRSNSGAQRSSGGGLATGAILAAVMALVQSQGGISGLVSKLRNSGLGSHADSWVGTGKNQSVSADDLHKALGGGAIGGMASQLGIDHTQAGGMLSKVLPELINQMTPHGAVPDNHGDLLSKGLEMLKGLRG
jgi:uncharacterized protein YidB (DUF937 family)